MARALALLFLGAAAIVVTRQRAAYLTAGRLAELRDRRAALEASRVDLQRRSAAPPARVLVPAWSARACTCRATRKTSGCRWTAPCRTPPEPLMANPSRACGAAGDPRGRHALVVVRAGWLQLVRTGALAPGGAPANRAARARRGREPSTTAIAFPSSSRCRSTGAARPQRGQDTAALIRCAADLGIRAIAAAGLPPGHPALSVFLRPLHRGQVERCASSAASSGNTTAGATPTGCSPGRSSAAWPAGRHGASA